MTTLVTDDFDEGNGGGYTVHNIVYGDDGWLDDLSDEVLTDLLGSGIIALVDVVQHRAGETRRYVSKNGVIT